MSDAWYAEFREQGERAVAKCRQTIKASKERAARPPRPVQGVGRHPRARMAAEMLLTSRHEAVLAMLTPGAVHSASALAREAGLTSSSLTATLYALADRGLVERVPRKGWRLRDG